VAWPLAVPGMPVLGAARAQGREAVAQDHPPGLAPSGRSQAPLRGGEAAPAAQVAHQERASASPGASVARGGAPLCRR
jgi:hypothetical protein